MCFGSTTWPYTLPPGASDVVLDPETGPRISVWKLNLGFPVRCIDSMMRCRVASHAESLRSRALAASSRCDHLAGSGGWRSEAEEPAGCDSRWPPLLPRGERVGISIRIDQMGFPNQKDGK
jgi:hypothetical protein